MDYLISAFILWLCAAVFTGIAVHARRAEKPMWFWSGTSVSPEAVRDIPAYNRANARMWMIYAVPFWVLPILQFFVKEISIFIPIWVVFGLFWMIWRYRRIEREFIRK